MTSSLTPTVEEKNPTDQNSFRQYTFLIQGKRWRISRLVLALILPTMAATAYLVVYTTAADNSLNPKTRYNVPLTPSSAGALPWYHLSFSTNSVSWRWCASS